MESIKKFFSKKLILIISGFVIGAINGFFGGGGGMLIVPVLTSLIGVSQKKAHATALTIILPLSIISGCIYLIKSNIKVDYLFLTGLGNITGGIIGAVLLKKIPSKKIAPIFYIIMIFAGIFLLKK